MLDYSINLYMEYVNGALGREGQARADYATCNAHYFAGNTPAQAVDAIMAFRAAVLKVA